jgi:flagellar hook-length control protein FliK
MKITDPQPPASDPNVNADDADCSQNTESDESSPFSQLLATKRGVDKEGAQSKGAKHNERDSDPTAFGFPQGQQMFDQTLQVAPIESKHLVTLPADLQQLVREISVVVNAAGNKEVHIDLNSSALKGLHIRIERQDGVMRIQFQSPSDEVAKLLSANVDALSQGLADRGVAVADIQVTSPRESAGVQRDKSRSNPGGRWQGGRQGGRQ